MRIRAIGLTLGLAAALAVGACHSPEGGLMPYTGGSTTYYSTQTSPKTVTLVDVRSGEILWEMAVPPGKQLTLDIVNGDGDDPASTPDLMRWQIFEIGTTVGRLRNSITVPSQNCLRFDVTVRPGPEYMEEPMGRALRADELRNRPDWWTPEGGELPEDPHGVENYDG